MLKKWFKKKITVNQLAQLYVGKMLSLVDESFPDIKAVIEMDPDFEVAPNLDAENPNAFIFIVTAYNQMQLSEFFDETLEKALDEAISEHFGKVYDLSKADFIKVISDYQQFLKKVNQPAKNMVHAMSKAVFYKYQLNAYQNEFFKSQNSPNPMLIKRLDEVMYTFVWDWTPYKKEYHIH